SYRQVVMLGDTQTSIFNSPYCWLYQHAASTVANASLRVQSSFQRSSQASGRLPWLRLNWAYRLHPCWSVECRFSMERTCLRLQFALGCRAPPPVAQDRLRQHGEDQQGGAVDDVLGNDVRDAEAGEGERQHEGEERVDVARDPSDEPRHRASPGERRCGVSKS